MPSVELFKKQGDVSDFIDATIEEDGRVQVVRNSFGPGDYETEVIAAVEEEDKDRLISALLEKAAAAKTKVTEKSTENEDRDQLLLALLKKVYGGNANAVEQFTDFARGKGIGVSRFRWP